MFSNYTGTNTGVHLDLFTPYQCVLGLYYSGGADYELYHTTSEAMSGSRFTRPTAIYDFNDVLAGYLNS